MRSPLYTLAGFKLGFAAAHLLPRHGSQKVGAAIARASYALNPHVRSVLRENLRLATGKNGRELDALCRANVANFGRMLADYFLCAGADVVRRADVLLEAWRGFENLVEARERGKGTIVVTGHLGHWELGGVLLARRGLPLTVVTLEEPSTELTRWRDAGRRRLGIKTIAVGPAHPFAFVEMIQTLRRNELLAMLVDRPYAGTGAPVHFFGSAAEFSTAPALLAQHTGAAVLPAFVLQRPSSRYESFADPIIPMSFEKGARASIPENTQRIATIFETIIRAHPEQWFNYAPVLA